MKNAQAMLDSWINSLQSNACIKKNDAVLKSIEFKEPEKIICLPEGNQGGTNAE